MGQTKGHVDRVSDRIANRTQVGKILNEGHQLVVRLASQTRSDFALDCLVCRIHRVVDIREALEIKVALKLDFKAADSNVTGCGMVRVGHRNAVANTVEDSLGWTGTGVAAEKHRRFVADQSNGFVTHLHIAWRHFKLVKRRFDLGAALPLGVGVKLGLAKVGIRLDRFNRAHDSLAEVATRMGRTCEATESLESVVLLALRTTSDWIFACGVLTN
jgi:hypothetical protein